MCLNLCYLTLNFFYINHFIKFLEVFAASICYVTEKFLRRQLYNARGIKQRFKMAA